MRDLRGEKNNTLYTHIHTYNITNDDVLSNKKFSVVIRPGETIFELAGGIGKTGGGQSALLAKQVLRIGS